MSGPAALSRAPIRTRLTAAFVLVMAVLLTATGAYVHHAQAADLNRTIDTGLSARAQEIAALLDASDGRLESEQPGLATRAEDVGQVIDAGGHVYDLSAIQRGRSLLTPAQLATARRTTLSVATARPAGFDGTFRVFARPKDVGTHHFVIVVATSLAKRDATLRSLTRELLLGGSGALLIAALSGFAVASAALRPVEAMRARAASISGLHSGERLPEPGAQDEVGRLARTLNEMLGRLEDQIARERAFIADASHELRTPLTILRTELELALSQPRSAAALRAAIRSAGEETDHLARLAEDLLMLARAEGSAVAPDRRPVVVGDLLADARDQARGPAAARGRAVEVLEHGTQIVSGDRAALLRALGNLVDNALVHGQGTITLSARAPAGGTQVDVVQGGRAPAGRTQVDEVQGSQVQGGQVQIEVSDQGTELDQAFAAHAFERFARAPQARSRPGSGLGLAIVAAIAHAHGGDAGMVPDGPGTRAWIRLPTQP